MRLGDLAEDDLRGLPRGIVWLLHATRKVGPPPPSPDPGVFD